MSAATRKNRSNFGIAMSVDMLAGVPTDRSRELRGRVVFSRQNRREQSIAVSATVTTDTTRPVIQPAALAATRIAASAVPIPRMPAKATRRATTDSNAPALGFLD